VPTFDSRDPLSLHGCGKPGQSTSGANDPMNRSERGWGGSLLSFAGRHGLESKRQGSFACVGNRLLLLPLRAKNYAGNGCHVRGDGHLMISKEHC